MNRISLSKIVQTRDDFIRELHDFIPDIILSEYYLSGFTGSEALALVQKKSSWCPFYFSYGKT
jgi:hypothetical protein